MKAIYEILDENDQHNFGSLPKQLVDIVKLNSVRKLLQFATDSRNDIDAVLVLANCCSTSIMASNIFEMINRKYSVEEKGKGKGKGKGKVFDIFEGFDQVSVFKVDAISNLIMADVSKELWRQFEKTFPMRFFTNEKPSAFLGENPEFNERNVIKLLEALEKTLSSEWIKKKMGQYKDDIKIEKRLKGGSWVYVEEAHTDDSWVAKMLYVVNGLLWDKLGHVDINDLGAKKFDDLKLNEDGMAFYLHRGKHRLVVSDNTMELISEKFGIK